MRLFRVVFPLVLVVVPLSLSGCAASGPKFSPVSEVQTNAGVLYIYRQSAFANILISPGIVLDGQEYAVLPSGGYMPFVLESGSHIIELKLSDRYSGEAKANINIEPQQASYVRVETWNEWKGLTTFRRFRITERPEDVGRGEIAACTFQDPKSGNNFSKSLFLRDN